MHFQREKTLLLLESGPRAVRQRSLERNTFVQYCNPVALSSNTTLTDADLVLYLIVLS